MQMQSTLQRALHEQMMKISALEQQRALEQQELKSLIENLRSETGRLDRALSRPQPRGAWGEVILEKILELSGLIKDQHYSTQLGLGAAQDHLRPDVVVYLPGKLSVVIDAKVPMAALLDGDEQSHMRHAAQLKSHIQELGSKAYWDRLKSLSPEFVVLFVPDEGMLSAALRTDPSLFELAARQRVMLTSPHNLISLLRTIAFGWRQEDVSENARQIAEHGKKVYEAVRVFAEHFEKLGRQLGQSVDAYNKSLGSLETTFLPAARRIKDLGAVDANAKEIAEIVPLDSAPKNATKPELLPRAANE
jgi:DNA recombination protein RmuC